MDADKEGMVGGGGGGGGVGLGFPHPSPLPLQSPPLPLDFKNKSSVINNTITTIIMAKRGLFKFLC